MPGLGPGIHAFAGFASRDERDAPARPPQRASYPRKTWMAGTSPAMTRREQAFRSGALRGGGEPTAVMPGLGPGIHAFAGCASRDGHDTPGSAAAARLMARRTWMAGTSPAMTASERPRPPTPAAAPARCYARSKPVTSPGRNWVRVRPNASASPSLAECQSAGTRDTG
jgi:hypothetical protein